MQNYLSNKTPKEIADFLSSKNRNFVMCEELKWSHFLFGLQSKSGTGNPKQVLLQKKNTKNHLSYRNPILQLQLDANQGQTQINAKIFPGIDFYIALVLISTISFSAFMSSFEPWMAYMILVSMLFLTSHLIFCFREKKRYKKILKHIAKEL